MKNPNLDVLYSQLDKHIQLAESYTEIKHLSFLIKSCRLKPHTYVFKDKSIKLILHRWWFDEFGNSLHLDAKVARLVYNDLNLSRNDIVCTDLYYGFSIEKTIKISKIAHICFGKDDDLYQDCAIVTLLGIDGYLRSFMYLYGEWQRVSPLLLGIKNIQMISQNLDIKYFKRVESIESSPLPCVSSEQWLCFMPARNEFLSLLSVHCQPVHVIFNTKE